VRLGLVAVAVVVALAYLHVQGRRQDAAPIEGDQPQPAQSTEPTPEDPA
jgi:hypothetical protein